MEVAQIDFRSGESPISRIDEFIRDSCAFPSSHSSLKVSSCEIPLSAAVSAPASRDAMTCVAPPVEQPYCSADETRLYTSRCVMNCSAYDSNYRPMMRKNTTFFQIVAIDSFTP